MKKSKKLLTLLLATLLVLAMMIGVVACNPPEDPTNDDTSDDSTTTTTETLLVNNGKFASATGATYVKTASNWTLNTGAWSKATTGLTTGIVDVSSETFETNKGAINASIATPGVAPSTPKTDGVHDDTNALVISMDGDEKNGSIYYASAKVTVKKGTYYKLTTDVWTDLILDETANNSKRGAGIVISQGNTATGVVIAQFLSINTNKQWKTYEAYIEGSNIEDREFYVQLWLGYGPSQNYDIVNKGNTAYDSDYTTRGSAMFDNVTMVEVEKSEYDNALVNQYNALANDNKTERTQEMQKAYGVVNGDSVVLSYEFLNNNFTGATGVSPTSNYKYALNSAKVGASANYTFITGKENLDDKDGFPSYSTSASSTDALGVFDMSKLYYNYVDSQDASKNDTYANAYGKIEAGFIPPVANDGFGISYTPENGYKFTREDNPLETQALLIYHPDYAISGAGYQSAFNILIENNKYYAISVWAFIWVPEMAEVQDPGTAPTDESSDEYKTWQENKAKYDAYLEYSPYYNKTASVKATLRLKGASTKENPEVQTTKSWGQWEQMTLYVKGNELADRKVNLELWYGEGELGSDGLYPGGCFFDNVSIMEYEDVTALENAHPGATAQVKEWESFMAEDYDGFGLNNASQNYVNLGNEEVDGWYYNVIDKNTYVDMDADNSNLYAGILSGSAVNSNADLSGIKGLNGLTFTADDVLSLVRHVDADFSDDTDVDLFDFVVLNHAKYTASKLYYKPSDTDTVLKTIPNKFYRLSMWVKTQNLKSGSTFSISLYDAESDAIINSSATQASLSVEDWTEISFVIQSSATESDEMYLLVEFGKGDIYTPASHTNGAVIMTALTWKEIEYTEYKNASGSFVKSFDLSGSTSTGSSISNSDFSAIGAEDYEKKDEDEAIFNEKGEIIGVATPKNWKIATEANLISAPTVTTSGTYIQWKETLKVDNTNYKVYYHIYNEDKELIKVLKVADAIDGTDYDESTANDVTTRTYKYQTQSNKVYYVRAIVLDSTEQNIVAASPLAKPQNKTNATGTVETALTGTNAIEEALESVKGGIINAETYEGTGLPADFYPAGDNDTLGYTSTLSSNLLMLTSQYPTYFGYTNTSAVSLSTESFYRLSVWVKTIGDTKASVTLKNSSNYLKVTSSGTDAGEYVGYTGINTADKWVRYDFYIATNLSAGSVNLELYLGNKYANNSIELATDGTMISSGASAGTVYFDDVMLVKLADESAYNKLVYGVENLDDLTEEVIKEKMAGYGVDVNADGVEFTLKALREARKAYNLNLLTEKSATDTHFNNGFKFELVNYTTDSFDNYDKKTEDPKNTIEELMGNEANSFTHYEPDAVFNGSGAGETNVKDNDYPNHVYGVYNKNDDFDKLVDHMLKKEYLGVDGASYAIADKGYTADGLKKFLSTTYNDDRGDNNNNYLMMANITKPSAQYYQSSNLTMAATSYYKITFYAKYLSANEDSNKLPEFRFVYDKSNDKWQTIQIKAVGVDDGMVEYTFLYANESSKSVTAQIAYYLGSDDAQGDAEDVKNLMAGIVIIDDLSIEKVTKDEYSSAKTALENDTTKAGQFSSYLTEAEKKDDETPVEDDEEETEEEEEGKQINPQVWLIISSVVIGLILVAVIVIMIYRKLKTKVAKKLRKTKVDSAMPADFEKKQAQEKVRKSADGKKKDIDTSDYND